MRRLRGIAAVIGVNLGLLLIAAVIAELVFGGWFSDDGLDRLNIHRGVALRFSADGLYPGADEVIYRRDRWGFRGEHPDPAAITHLTLGGSTTNQIYLDEDETWQAVLQERLRAAGRTDAVVANAGIDGQTTVGHLRAFEVWLNHIPGLKPRLVLVYAGLNDVLLDDPGHADTLDSFSSWSSELRRKSALYYLGTTIAGMIAANRGRMTHHRLDYESATWTTAPREPMPADALSRRVAAYGTRLDRLAERITALGAMPVFITQARGDARRRPDGTIEGVETGSGMNGVDWQSALDAFNAETLAACERGPARCLDLAGDLRFGPGDFYDTVHNTPQGARKIGEWLAARLLAPAPGE